MIRTLSLSVAWDSIHDKPYCTVNGMKPEDMASGSFDGNSARACIALKGKTEPVSLSVTLTNEDITARRKVTTETQVEV